MTNIPIEREAAEVNSKDAVIANILENLPAQETVELALPSKAKFYSLPDPSQPITMRPMNFEDEKTIASLTNSNTNEDPVNILLNRCVSNLKVNDLLLVDKVYLILKLREISYGHDFNASITCGACHKVTPVEFDLRTLPVNYFPDELAYPIELELPVAKKVVKLKLPTVADERLVSDSAVVLNQIWRFIDSIDGQVNKELISEVVDLLPLKDIHSMLDVIAGSEYGVQTQVQFQCYECKENAVIELPITPDFFTVS